MAEFAAERDEPRGRAGLLLLYAENHAELPSVYPLDRRPLVLGRERPADLVVPVAAVSRRHAELTWEAGSHVLRDLASTNGTLVDGRRVVEARLEDGQEIRVGDALFKYVAADADAHAPYHLDGRRDGLPRADTELVGGLGMARIVAELDRVARSALTVLVVGESGTGKEVVARELHRGSGRTGPLRAVNCAAIPEHLLESELFGSKRGAFSGADRDRPGLIRAAHGGTLLLDEIGDMPADAQVKLLRVLQTREVVPVGGTQPEPVDVRVVAATHRDLARLQEEERFRPDLYARLAEYTVALPPLRDRKEDLYLLLRTFLDRHGGAALRPSLPFLVALFQHDWPYNVRELEAVARRAIALADGTVLEPAALPDSVRDAMDDYGRGAAALADTAQREATRGTPTEAELRALLAAHDGNVAAVGRALGKARMQIHRWVGRYGIDLDGYRPSGAPPGAAPG
ncbi:MAG: sigma 54-interacting transcriptional regulator [Deltaproteobacteria bacterium]|nr:sigma 54-interacting transcriptional regulator [Deltaproteobacteria bacterium]